MDYMFKLVLFGDGGVGKTTLVERFVNGTFLANTRITMGVQFLFKKFKLNVDTINLQIWDLGGEDRFRFVFPGYCEKCNGGIFVFDVTTPNSLYHLRDWMQIVRERKATFPIIMVGTKIDLKSQRQVKKKEEIAVAGQNHIQKVIEVSSKTGTNVDLVFNTITRLMLGDTKHENLSRAMSPTRK